MNYKQEQTPINIIVRRDNELDPDYIRSLRVAKAREIGAVFVSGAFTALEAVSTGLGKLVTPVALELADSMYHTDMRHQYFEKQRTEAAEELAQMIGLND